MSIAPEIVAAARQAQAAHGIPASVLLAQYGAESAWGRHMPPGSCNPFGEKALAGQPSVAAATHEVVGGRTVAVHAPFRVYASLEAAFESHAAHLATSARYAAARAALPDAEGFCRGLNGVYATDPDYAAKLIAIIRSGDLTRYDAPAAPPAA
jgi:flagellum-specific peptidoglycan hydrolase FlgJ